MDFISVGYSCWRVVAACALIGACGTLRAATVYENTTINFSMAVYSDASPEYGDTIALGGTERVLTDATVRFSNTGAAGSFDATLRFFDASSPLLAVQIGPDYTLTGIAINEFTGGPLGSATAIVTFAGLNLPVDDSLIFTVAAANLTQGLNLGLNQAEPPTVGSSDNRMLLQRNGQFLLPVFISPGFGNFYFQLNATEVPEPGTFALAAFGGCCVAFWRTRPRLRANSDLGWIEKRPARPLATR